jgi:hypothetical protein
MRAGAVAMEVAAAEATQEMLLEAATAGAPAEEAA